MNWLEMDVTHLVIAAQHPWGQRDRQELLTAFLPLLRRVARIYQSVAGYDEAYQEACLALLRAIVTYRPEAGPFPAYAKARVHGDVRTAMRRLWRAAERQAFAPLATSDDDTHPTDIGETLAHVAHVSHNSEPFGDAVDRCLLQDVIERLAASAGLSARERMWLDAALCGQTTEELAKAQGVSYDTAKTWRRRAIEKLRRAAARAGLTASEIL
ncbi:sigma-70 family RNA polymerase sigma factor [Alicyclobacillus hesperidum]|uniref:sigma-70 family RNA polymerase sigma factor n=1 Tax=Alicyclobacillus hesperidum TaxID=89784 RepID=UPI0024931F3A|nr:sigma-70 family RNA polymerase sigma factor [Alicyclobacillus hesperidum]